MWYFLKNNFKLIYRSRVLFFILILLTITIIALLADSFNNFLETNKKLESFRSGYTCKENSFMKSMLPQFQKMCEENGITLSSVKKETGIQDVKDGNLDTYVEFKEDNYELYQGKDTVGCGIILDNLLVAFSTEYKQYVVAKANHITLPEENMNTLQIQNIEIDPVPNAKTYYGIVEVLYFMWFGIISIAAIYISENRHKVQKRYDISTLSSQRFYLGKLLAGVAALCIQMGSAIVLSVVFLDIDWGNVFYKSAGILLLQSVAVSSLSILLYQLFRSTAVVLSLDFTLLFIFSFLGGSFQPYFYNTFSKGMEMFSPQYYLNRTLVEYVTKGKSDYTIACIGILLVIILVCSSISLLLLKKRRGA